jgi:phage terminase large subunit
MSGRTLEINLPYAPLPKQEQAHGLNAKYRGFCGGWGNGKTSWGCVETFTTAMEYPGINIIVARKTRPELKSTTWDMLVNGDPSQPTGWHGIPQELIKSHNRTELTMELITTDPQRPSKIYGLPLDDPKKIENYNLGFFWIDQAEEVDEEIFLKFHGRLRQLKAPREGIMTFNPAGHNYLWRRMIDPDRSDAYKRNYACIEATTYDNPNLPEDYFEQFEGLPEAWIQRFVQGSHDVFTGQIFTDYNPDIHLVQPFRIPESWQRMACIDPGIRHEGAVSWVARDPVGNCYYYREHLQSNQPVSWWASLIRSMEAQSDWGGPNEHVIAHMIGPEAQQRAQTDGKSVIQLYWEHGIYPEIADKDPPARISKITEFLRPSDSQISPFDGSSPAPKLYIFDTCEKLKLYLPQYRWRPQRANYAEEDSPEKPRKKDDHNVDNLGHILLAYDPMPLPEGDAPHLAPEQRILSDLMDECWAEAEAQHRGHHDILSV